MARRKYHMTSTDYENLNRKAIPFNIAIMAIALVCSITLFFGNFWKVKVKFKITEDTLNSLVDMFEGSIEGSEPFNPDNLDFSAVEGLSIKVSLSIKRELLLAALFGDGTRTAERLSSSFISDLLGQITGIIDTALKATVRIIVPTVLNEIQVEIEDNYNFLDDIVLDDLNETIDMLVEGIEKEVLIERLNSIVEYIADKAELEGPDYGNFMSRAGNMINGTVERLAEIFESEEVISLNNTISNFIKETLVEEMPRNVINAIHYSILGLAILLLITAAAWVALFIFAFIRLFTEKKVLYLGTARGFGILPYTLLVIIPWVAWMLLKIQGIKKHLPESVLNILGVSSVEFTSIAVISFAGAIVFALIKWFGYGKIKKRIKNAKISNEFNDFLASHPGDSPTARLNEFSAQNDDYSYYEDPDQDSDDFYYEGSNKDDNDSDW